MKLQFFSTIILIWFSLVSSQTTLSCYDCDETFEDRWDPYTDCQVYPESTPIKPCLEHEIYCLVQRVTVKGMTTSIKRKCTSECYYGCRAHNFGLTTMTCTSCCQTPRCNTDSSAVNPFTFSLQFVLTITCCLLTSLFL